MNTRCIVQQGNSFLVSFATGGTRLHSWGLHSLWLCLEMQGSVIYCPVLIRWARFRQPYPPNHTWLCLSRASHWNLSLILVQNVTHCLTYFGGAHVHGKDLFTLKKIFFFCDGNSFSFTRNFLIAPIILNSLLLGKSSLLLSRGAKW